MLRYMKTESKSTIEIQCENPHISTSIIFLMTKDSCQIPGAFITFCLPLQIFVPNPSHLPFSRCSIFQGFFHFLSKATILTCKIEMHYATYMHICVAICIQMYVIMVLLQCFTFSINFSWLLWEFLLTRVLLDPPSPRSRDSVSVFTLYMYYWWSRTFICMHTPDAFFAAS